MKTTERLLITGAAALTLLFGGCTGGYYSAGPYEGPYVGGFGPYGYGGDLVIGTSHYQNHYGNHHFYGRSFGARHIAVAVIDRAASTMSQMALRIRGTAMAIIRSESGNS